MEEDQKPEWKYKYLTEWDILIFFQKTREVPAAMEKRRNQSGKGNWEKKTRHKNRNNKKKKD